MMSLLSITLNFLPQLNSVFGGKPVGNNQFFFVQIQDLSQIQLVVIFLLINKNLIVLIQKQYSKRDSTYSPHNPHKQ